MSIYSANRSKASGPVVENKAMAYRCADQIMYESEINNMRIFEAALNADFVQIQGLREGTLLEAEAKDKDEANRKSLKQKIVELWEALKKKINEAIEAIRNTMKKIYLSSTKLVMARFKKIPNDKFDSSKTIKYRPAVDIDHQETDLGKVTEIVRTEANKEGDFDRTSFINAMLGNYCNNGEATTFEDMKKKVLGSSFGSETELKLDKSTIETEIIKKVVDMKKELANLEKERRDVLKAVDDALKVVKGESDKSTANNSRLLAIGSAYQLAATQILKVQNIARIARIKKYNEYLNNAINALTPSAEHEAFMMESDAVITNAEDDTPDVIESDAEFDKMVADTMVDVKDIVSDDNKE